MSGSIDVGFEFDRDPKYCIRLKKRNVIGAYNCTFNKKTLFIYKVSNELECYTIRKLNWIQLINNTEYKRIIQILKGNITLNYLTRIKDRIILL